MKLVNSLVALAVSTAFCSGAYADTVAPVDTKSDMTNNKSTTGEKNAKKALDNLMSMQSPPPGPRSGETVRQYYMRLVEEWKAAARQSH